MSAVMVEAELPSDRSDRVGQARTLFKAIRLPYPRQAELHVALDELRLTTQHSRGKPQGGIQTIAPWGSGKTAGAEMYAEKAKLNGNFSEYDQPVVIATLDTSGTAVSVPNAILRALNEPRFDGTKLSTQWMRAQDALRDARTQLLMIDEMDRATRRPTISNSIAGSLRDLADTGICALAFLCTDLSRNLFRNCQDLNERLDAPVTMEPLDMRIDEDREIFENLLKGFDQAMVDAGILRSLSGLDERVVATLLAESCNGILRQLARIIETAMIAVVRRDGSAITQDDLANAVDDWSISKGLLDENPFRSPA